MPKHAETTMVNYAIPCRHSEAPPRLGTNRHCPSRWKISKSRCAQCTARWSAHSQHLGFQKLVSCVPLTMVTSTSSGLDRVKLSVGQNPRRKHQPVIGYFSIWTCQAQTNQTKCSNIRHKVLHSSRWKLQKVTPNHQQKHTERMGPVTWNHWTKTMIYPLTKRASTSFMSQLSWGI